MEIPEHWERRVKIRQRFEEAIEESCRAFVQNPDVGWESIGKSHWLDNMMYYVLSTAIPGVETHDVRVLCFASLSKAIAIRAMKRAKLDARQMDSLGPELYSAALVALCGAIVSAPPPLANDDIPGIGRLIEGSPAQIAGKAITERAMSPVIKHLIREMGNAISRELYPYQRGRVWGAKDLSDYVTESPPTELLDILRDACENPRDEQIIQLKAEGYTNKEVAERTGLSKHQVQRIVRRIREVVGSELGWQSHRNQSAA